MHRSICAWTSARRRQPAILSMAMKKKNYTVLFVITVKINLQKNIAKHIVAARQVKPITTTGELTEIIRESIPMKMQVKSGHPAKRTFQAIRIELNRELDVLRDSLDGMIDILDDGGRLCIITFHSLEDRIVKTISEKMRIRVPALQIFLYAYAGRNPKEK